MFDEHRGAVDQDVEIVDRGEAIFRVGRNMDGNFSVRTDIVDRLQALALGQGKEWAFHRFALVAKRQCRQLRQKEVYLTVFAVVLRSEEHTSDLQSLMRISYAVFCLNKKTKTYLYTTIRNATTHQHTLDT